jgi:RNA polymerase sigma factor (sigma-70 family)
MTDTSQSRHRPARRPVNAKTVTLLRRAQSGDRDAFAQLYRQHVAGVRRYVAARLRNWDRDAVPDLVQDTFTAALANLHRAHDDVHGWLLHLAATMCVRHGWRQRSHWRAVLTLEAHQRSQAATVPAPAPHTTRRSITQALAVLGPQEQRTIQLRFLDGHPQHTTAQIMACSRRTVRRRQQRALRQLAAQLTAGPSDPRAPAVAG